VTHAAEPIEIEIQNQCKRLEEKPDLQALPFWELLAALGRLSFLDSRVCLGSTVTQLEDRNQMNIAVNHTLSLPLASAAFILDAHLANSHASNRMTESNCANVLVAAGFYQNGNRK